MAGINNIQGAGNDLSVLFNQSTAQGSKEAGASFSDYADYATIKSGSYGKLLKAYYNTDTAKASDSIKASELTAVDKAASGTGAVYEKGTAREVSGLYSINKMSTEDRANLVTQLKNDQAARMKQLSDIVTKTIDGQANTFAKANNIWSILSKGDFTVDAATKAQATEDISEDGYWGVKQTSQRLFDFASALAGDDVNMMHKMQDAVKKGFEMAGGAWGRELPQISYDTMDATNKLFDDYYASKTASETNATALTGNN